MEGFSVERHLRLLAAARAALVAASEALDVAVEALVAVVPEPEPDTPPDPGSLREFVLGETALGGMPLISDRMNIETMGQPRDDDPHE